MIITDSKKRNDIELNIIAIVAIVGIVAIVLGFFANNKRGVSSDLFAEENLVGQALDYITSITLTSPIPGSKLEKGKTYDVTWTSTALQEPLTIDLHKVVEPCSNNVCPTGPGTFKGSIAIGTENDGIFKWTVSNNLETGDYFLYIHNLLNTVGDPSDQSFKVIEQQQNADVFTLESDLIEAHLQDGQLIFLKNKDTGTVYINRNQAQRDGSPLVLFADGARHRNPSWQIAQDFIWEESDKVFLENAYKIDANSERIIWYFSENGVNSTLTAQLGPEGRDLIFSLSSQGQRTNLHRLRFLLNGINHKMLDLILPVQGGIRLTEGETLVSREYFTWPRVWNAQFAVLQGDNEGFWVRSDDVSFIQKGLEVDRTSGNISLGFDTEAPTPFNNKNSLQSVKWILSPYSGEWTMPVHNYRLWMENNYYISPKPDWVDNIQLILWNIPLTSPNGMNVLADLSTLVNPNNVLVGTAAWATNYFSYEYRLNSNFVDSVYTPAASLGFDKFMIWINPKSVRDDGSYYLQFKDYTVKDPVTGTEWPDWIPDLAYISFASNAWRNFLIGKINGLWETLSHKPPAVYFDESLFITQHQRGKIDGKNSAEGSIALHQEFIDNVPVGGEYERLVLTGEGLNEISFMHEAFTQGQAYEKVISYTYYNAENRRVLIPVHALLFGPYTRQFFYPWDHNSHFNRLNDLIDTYEMLRYEPQITMIPVRNYRQSGEYYYICENDDGSRDTPLVPLQTCILNSGIKRMIDRANGITHKDPVLTNITLSLKDKQGKIFSFSVRYTDLDGEGPGTEENAYVRVIIDGIPYEMTPSQSVSANKYVAGLDFSFQKELSEGLHNYHYEAWDTWKVVRYPKVGQLQINVISNFCGDGNIDSGEQCDDNNTLSGDGCSSACQIETCSEQNGFICSSDQLCPGTSLTSSNTNRCCDVACVTAAGNTCDTCGDGLTNICGEQECLSLGNCEFIDNIFPIPNECREII